MVKADAKNKSKATRCLQACIRSWDLVNAQQVWPIIAGLGFGGCWNADQIMTDCGDARQELSTRTPVLLLECPHNIYAQCEISSVKLASDGGIVCSRTDGRLDAAGCSRAAASYIRPACSETA